MLEEEDNDYELPNIEKEALQRTSELLTYNMQFGSNRNYLQCNMYVN